MTYRLSFYAKSDGPGNGPLTASIESTDGTTVFATAQVPAITGSWQKYTATLTTNEVYSAFFGRAADGKTFYHGHTYTGNSLGAAAVS